MLLLISNSTCQQETVRLAMDVNLLRSYPKQIIIINNLTMVKGVFQISSMNVNLSEAQSLDDEDLIVQLRVGNQKTLIHNKGKVFQSHQAALFSDHQVEILEVFVYKEESSSTQNDIIYGEVDLSPLRDIPYTKHMIIIHTVYMDSGILRDTESGTIEIAVIFTPELDAILQLNIESANLVRNTEIVGKMDPYCIITVGDVERRTTVKKNAGKSPIWNEQFFIIFKEIKSSLVIVVKDEDVTTSDLVGSVELPLRELGILQTSTEWNRRIVNLVYHGKTAGTLLLGTRFNVTMNKK